MKDYGRKPYISKSYYEMMKRPPLAAIQNELKTKYGQFEPKSEFEKPYLSDNYEEMQHYYPPPITNLAWPDMVWPEFSGPIPINPEQGWVGWYITGCSLTCTPSIIRDCAEGVEFCCMLNPAWQPVDSISIEGPATLTKKGSVTGDEICFTLNDDAEDGDKVVIKVKTKAKAGQYKTGRCKGSFSIACDKVTCDCPSDIALDSENPTTIAAGGSAVFTITGGCPPFTWHVTGTGYSWDSATTTGRSNTLNCASGTCDTQYDPYCTYYVSDDCPTNSATDYVRCTTDGSWHIEYRYNCSLGIACTCWTEHEFDAIHAMTLEGTTDDYFCKQFPQTATWNDSFSYEIKKADCPDPCPETGEAVNRINNYWRLIWACS